MPYISLTSQNVARLGSLMKIKPICEQGMRDRDQLWRGSLGVFDLMLQFFINIINQLFISKLIRQGMHLFEVSFYFAGAYYAIFHKQQLFIPFLFTIAIYYFCGYFVKGKDVSSRKKIMLATWADPQLGNAIVRVNQRVDKVLQLIQKYEGNKKPTLNHFVLKAVGQMFNITPDLNTNLALGKAQPYETIDISCLVDINQGKDLTRIVIKEIDKKSVENIRDIIKEESSKMKKDDGGAQYKSQISSLKYIPACLVGFITPIIFFITNKLGIELKWINHKKHNFGCIIVSSVSGFNLQDTASPLIDCCNVAGVVTCCTVQKAPVVENDQVVIGNVMQVNFVMDHRFIDGGRCTKLFPTLKKVFEQPELYVDSFK